MPPVHAEAGKSIKSVVEDRFDGLVKSQKSELFTSVKSADYYTYIRDKILTCTLYKR
jgi:hypothetical protein